MKLATLFAERSQPPAVLPLAPPAIFCCVYFHLILEYFNAICSPRISPAWMLGATPPVGDGVAGANTDIYGRWRIARILDYADISALSEQQARRLLGKTIVVAKDKLVIGGETCNAPSYERTIEDTAKTMREKGHVSSANMGLPEQVTVIDAGCTVFFLKAPDRIVIQWRGFYFDAVRQKR